VRDAHKRRKAEMIEHLENCMEYKNGAENAIARARRLGEPAPEIIPHPDDIVIASDGTISFVKPSSQPHNTAWYEARKRMADANEEIAESRKDALRRPALARFYHYEIAYARRITAMTEYTFPTR